MTCAIEDLRADAVMTLLIDSDGQPYYEEPCGLAGLCTEFWCVGCDETFEPEDRDSSESKREAWQAALAHLGKTEAKA